MRRVLPALAVRTVGPFIFFDHIGPATLVPGAGLDVRPHPHIGLATVTYLFDGAIMHRDSLGSVQKIVPGDVNWMTAGRGIVHSERTPDEERASGQTMHGIQTWVALPVADEDTEPSFEHHPAANLPQIERNGVTLRVIAGSAFGATAPTKTFSSTLYVAAHFGADAEFALEPSTRNAACTSSRAISRSTARRSPNARWPCSRRAQPSRSRARTAPSRCCSAASRSTASASSNGISCRVRARRSTRPSSRGAKQRIGQVPGETEFIPLPPPRREDKAPEA